MSAAIRPSELYHAMRDGRPDPGDGAALYVRENGVVYNLDIAAGAAETGTVPNPDRAGVVAHIVARSVGSGGTRALTFAAAVNPASETVVTFAAAGDRVTILSKEVTSGVYRWEAVDFSGVTGLTKTLATADLTSLKLGGTAVGATAEELNSAADLSANGGLVRVKKLSISSTPTGSEQDTTWDLPGKALLLDVFVDVTTAEATGATKTLDVGLKASESGGDADGFIDGIDVSSTGIKRPGVTVITGGSETYVGSWNRGVLLTAGTPVAGTNTNGDFGVYHEKPHASTAVTAKSVVYTAGSNDFAEFRGAIYLVYVELG